MGVDQTNTIHPPPETFWREAFTLAESVTPRVLPYVVTFGLIATAVAVAGWVAEAYYGTRVGLEVGFHEIGGVVLTIAIILRTNAGYDRWWEARKLWGGIVNQCRNLAISALAYGPKDDRWRRDVVRWAAVFPHAARSALEGRPLPPEVAGLVGPDAAGEVAAAQHPPSFVALRLGGLLEEACRRGMPPLAFAQVDRERAMLIDHIGGCERILKTPLPQVYSIKIRRVLVLFLATLPLVLLNRVGQDWLVPVITLMIAYPLLSLDQIGHELQNPFSPRNLSHLPLVNIAATVERNLLGLLEADRTAARSGPPLAAGLEDGPDTAGTASVTR